MLIVCKIKAAPLSDVIGGSLSPDQIFKKARENYAKLSSYCDQGQAIIKVNGTTTTNPFPIQLSRPDADYYIYDLRGKLLKHRNKTIEYYESAPRLVAPPAGAYLAKAPANDYP